MVDDHPGRACPDRYRIGSQQDISIASVLQHEAEASGASIAASHHDPRNDRRCCREACEKSHAFKSVQGDLVRMWVRG